MNLLISNSRTAVLGIESLCVVVDIVCCSIVDEYENSDLLLVLRKIADHPIDSSYRFFGFLRFFYFEISRT